MPGWLPRRMWTSTPLPCYWREPISGRRKRTSGRLPFFREQVLTDTREREVDGEGTLGDLRFRVIGLTSNDAPAVFSVAAFQNRSVQMNEWVTSGQLVAQDGLLRWEQLRIVD